MLNLAKTVEFLTQLGHEAIHVRTLGLQRVLDKPSVIIFRLADERADSVNRRLTVVLEERVTDLQLGSLILVEDSEASDRALMSVAAE